MPTSAEVAAYISTLTTEVQAKRLQIKQLERDSAHAQALDDKAAAIEAGTPPEVPVPVGGGRSFIMRGQAALNVAAVYRTKALELWGAIVIPEPPA